MVYLCLVGLAKTLHFLNQQEIFIYHKACNRPSCERKWNAKVGFCFLIADKTKQHQPFATFMFNQFVNLSYK